MSEELNCMNCSIGDFKNALCDCNNGFCKEFKSIGNQEDFFNAVMQRIRPQGEWIAVSCFEAFGGDEDAWIAHGDPIAFHYCSECKEQTRIDEFGEEILSNYCPNCGAYMKTAEDERDYERAIEQMQYDMLYEPTYNSEDGSM